MQISKNDRLAAQKAESGQKCKPPLCHLQKQSLVISVLRKLFPCPISCRLIRPISCHVGPSHLISSHFILSNIAASKTGSKKANKAAGKLTQHPSRGPRERKMQEGHSEESNQRRPLTTDHLKIKCLCRNTWEKIKPKTYANICQSGCWTTSRDRFVQR